MMRTTRNGHIARIVNVCPKLPNRSDKSPHRSNPTALPRTAISERNPFTCPRLPVPNISAPYTPREGPAPAEMMPDRTATAHIPKPEKLYAHTVKKLPNPTAITATGLLPFLSDSFAAIATPMI